MLTSDKVPKLIDFGLAKETRYDGVGSTNGKLGTKDWMAPEQESEGGCSTASDVYSFGLVAYFLWSDTSPSEVKALSFDLRVLPPVQQTPDTPVSSLVNLTLSLIHKCVNPVRPITISTKACRSTVFVLLSRQSVVKCVKW
jgi:serine/threonine protein kinase